MASNIRSEKPSVDPAHAVLGMTFAPEHVFGLRKEICGAVTFIDNSRVMYPAGTFLVDHDTKNDNQRIVSLGKGESPTAMAISARR